ncbi:MAG: DUF2461 domain-containing protein [Gemmatimonadetes bacterium]|nr:DUF2461 domain-containing protein [Gemmatimonadota bacterium]
MSSPFRPALFRFLKDLKVNNNRDWFNANKERYEADVKEPLTQFVLDFGSPLRKISDEFVADPRKSVFRIYRDTRFSKNKAPYKTNAALHFRHTRAKDAHTPGFYLHLEPGNVFAGAGIWRPDTASVTKIREAIVDDPARWKRILNKKFHDRFELHGESLKRPPRGFDPDHPLIDDLKRKDFIAVASFTQKEASAADFPKRYAETCRAAVPLVRFLTEALDLDW